MEYPKRNFWCFPFALLVQLSTLTACAQTVKETTRPFDSLNHWCAGLEDMGTQSDYGCAEANVVSSPWVLKDVNQVHKNFYLWALEKKKIPYTTLYIIAGLAREELKLQDCNVGRPNLCELGAKYIRDHKAKILQSYTDAAIRLAELSKSNDIYIHIEPDFYQYVSDPKQKPPLTQIEGRNLLQVMVSIVRQNLPNAKIVLDLSPWAGESWLNQIGQVSGVNYFGITGKRVSPEGVDGKTYSQMFKLVGNHLLILNTAYGVAGKQGDRNLDWDKLTSEELKQMGILGIFQPANSKIK